jgi:hypothetical protein
MESAFRESLGDGETEAARGSGDESELGSCGHGERVAENKTRFGDCVTTQPIRAMSAKP